MPRSGARSARRASRARCARRRPVPPTWASTARCRASPTRTTVHARLIVLWGVNPSTSGIHLVPFIKEARKAGAKLVVIDPRATSLAQAGRPAPRAAARHRPGGRAGAAPVPVRERPRGPAVPRAARARRRRAARARRPSGPMARAAEVAGIDVADLERFAELYAATRPALIRCGWGLERNRNGGSAVAAGARAAGRRRQVRRARRRLLDEQLVGLRHQGGRVDERHAGAADAHRQHEQARRRAARLPGSRRSRCCSSTTATRWRRCRTRTGCWKGCSARTCSRSCSSRCSPTPRDYADVILPATTFLENYDIAKRLRPDQPAARAAGRSSRPARRARTRRSSPSSPSAWASASAKTETETLLRIAGRLPPTLRASSCSSAAPRRRRSAAGPIQFVDVFPLTPDRKVDLFPEALEAQAPAGLYAFQPDPGDRAVPAGADFSGEREDGVVDARRAARAARHAADASRPTPRRAASRTTIPCASSTSSAKCSARSRSPRTSARARSACRRACGGRAPTTARPSNALVARHADRPRRRRLLQRRARAGGVAGAALS